MWYWYLIVFMFGAALGGFLTLVGLLHMDDKNEID